MPLVAVIILYSVRRSHARVGASNPLEIGSRTTRYSVSEVISGMAHPEFLSKFHFGHPTCQISNDNVIFAVYSENGNKSAPIKHVDSSVAFKRRYSNPPHLPRCRVAHQECVKCLVCIPPARKTLDRFVSNQRPICRCS